MNKFAVLALFTLVAACSTPDPVADVTPIEGALVRGVNFNGGGGIEIAGYRWTGEQDSRANGMTMRDVKAIETSLNPKPTTDDNTNVMLNSAIAKQGQIEIKQVLYVSTYDFYFWFMENEPRTRRTMSIEIEGQTVEETMGNLAFKQWNRYGPYSVELSDGELNILITTDDPTQDAQVMGMLIVKPDDSGSS
ncbi:MAG: hypothetical protein AAGA75_20690 [Cyanobacteria bacterium P01_E01_bin.6]